MAEIIFIDTEVDPRTGTVRDIGGIRDDGGRWHSSDKQGFTDFLRGGKYLCGHNIIKHDIKYIGKQVKDAGIRSENIIDTLYLSPLLFPKRPYHKLVKDDKLQTDEINNPLNDSLKAKDLFYDEVAAYSSLDRELKKIYEELLGETDEFRAFFRYIKENNPQDAPKTEPGSGLFRGFRDWLLSNDPAASIKHRFEGKICANAALKKIASEKPIALAYCLALIEALSDNSGIRSVTPGWVLHNYPEVEQIMFLLRNSPCLEGCRYCDSAMDVRSGLKRWFGFDAFRQYGGKPLQENAAKAAVQSKSILAVFPTGGGKSVTFQLPALMAGECTGGLTVVISPLQSLMKDQVDNLEKKQITDAVTINGLLDPIERAKAVERVEDGSATILYISPESLRSKTIESLLLGRKIVRFVIDEAHCFSSWGQDFRVDYLFIADFIKNLQEKKMLKDAVPVSCFTATAKPQVIEDICEYFKSHLDLDLEIFSADVARPNLHYTVLPVANDDDKYPILRRLIEERQCPVIVYVTRTKTAEELSTRLRKDGFESRPYHGKMESDEKIANQNSFMAGKTRIIVATSAFGMGVDKSDVGLVVHYQISDSLENYIQEAGRAGRDQSMEADCYVLFNEEDLSKHFILLNQTKLTFKEIQQVWKAIKGLTKFRMTVSGSALEIAREAGWDDSVSDIETRVKTALASLEQSGYLKRGQNMPRVYATGILTDTAQEAIDKIESSPRFSENDKQSAIRIIKKLISSRSRQKISEDVPEARVDYISDHLGITKENVIHIINLLREEKILADTKDLSAYIYNPDNANSSRKVLKKYHDTEKFLAAAIDLDREYVLDLKALNEQAAAEGYKNINIAQIKTILNFWSITNIIKEKPVKGSNNHIAIKGRISAEKFSHELERRYELSDFIIGYLFGKNSPGEENARALVNFSELELIEAFRKTISSLDEEINIETIENALFFLSRIKAIRIEGGFLVIYNGMRIERLETDSKKRYKNDDYKRLKDFYANKAQQIHIVGEYARKMVDDYTGALQFVEDYFSLNYSSFLHKYFNGRKDELAQNMTPTKFRQLFGELSPAQLKIIKDKDSKYIVVAAGPGSGKTKLLVHKLASLLMMEDVRHEQLLMLTFSRAAATEFKQRLFKLIGGAAAFVEIKTFHSYCFDLLGQVGSVEKSEDIVKIAVAKILSGEVELSRITKTVLVLDEAQDMTVDEFNLVKALISNNEDMRVLAVGDDDQNIYEFRGSSAEYMKNLTLMEGAVQYELSENFRSAKNLVEFSNIFASAIHRRMKKYPIVSKSQDNGKIEIIQYRSGNIETPLVKCLLGTGLKGTTCVLTKTNDEALVVLGLLGKYGMPAKLIQTAKEVKLYNLLEIRYFMNRVGIREPGSVISEERWENAKKSLAERFRFSTQLEICQNLIKVFESTNRESIYKSDFETFVWESSLEDFVKTESETILVSTIHKVKGREFDNVFLMLKNFDDRTDESKRQLYVALTRAKGNLSIHLNTALFSGISTASCTHLTDSREYGEPDEITLMLSHKDIYLGSAKSSQSVIGELMSGEKLQMEDNKVIHNYRTVISLSKSFMEKFAKLQAKGYTTADAQVNMIVYWKGEDHEKELMIVLPVIHLRR